MFLYLIFVFSLANTAVVALQLSILTPLQSQRPLIARLGASYSWNLSSSTFGYENGLTPNVTYDANGLPPWLTFSSNTRSFTGLVPSSWNVGAFPITVTATDDSSRASDSFQFLVSGEPEPQVAIPLAHQINPNNPALSPAFPVNPSSALPPYLSSTTASHGEAGLRVPPTWAFSFGFQGGTFYPWPLFYSATLANGDPLPSWIRYDTSTFTFDGTAPDVDSEEIEILYMASDEDGYSTHAVETFWVVVAAHELKLRDASVGIRRNVSTGCEFEVDLLDGGDADPFVGEVLWDAGPLPRGSIHNLTLDTSGTHYLYNGTSQILTGSVPATPQPQTPPAIPLRIIDSQNLTQFTHLTLNPIPGLFQLPPNASVNDSGVMVVTANRSDISALNIRTFMTPEGQAAVRAGRVNISMTAQPDSVRSWFTFDQNGFIMASNVPSDLDDGVTQNAGIWLSTTFATNSSVAHKRRKHHRSSRLEEAYELSSTTSLETVTSYTSRASQSPNPTVLHTSLPSSINITFLAHSFDSRTTSKLRMRFDMNATTTCTPTSNACATASSTPAYAEPATHLAAILAIVFSVLLSAFLLCVLFFLARKRRSWVRILRKNAKHGADDKVDPYVLKQQAMGGSNLGPEDLERGVGGRITSIIPPSMAETRSVATSETRGGSAGNSHVPNPTTAGRKNAGGNGNESNTESSESRYEEESSAGTRLRNAAITGVGNGGMISEREGISSSESGNGGEIGGYHLAPPMSAFDRSSPTSIRSNSPTPSSATAASARSGATIPKQTFFAKLKTFGPPHLRDPISSSSEDETSRAPKVSPKPSMFAKVVPTIKESSLGSLFGLGGDESVKKKSAISKPRPLMPSLGAYLVRDHAEQVARAAASNDIVSRQESDGGASFTGGTAIIYSMRNSPIPIIQSTSPLPAVSVTTSFSPMPNPYSPQYQIPNDTSGSRVEVEQLIRQRSTRSALPAASSQGESFSSTSESTVTGNDSRDSRVLNEGQSNESPPKEIPRRRVDFSRPKSNLVGHDPAPASPQPVQESYATHQQSLLRSEDSTDSLAVVTTAALAIRSPMAGAKLVPSLRPSRADGDSTVVGSQPKGETGLIHKARLVQFVHERQYDGSSSSEADERVPGAYSTYQGKREISQKAMVGGSSGTPPERWEEVMDVPPTPVLGVTIGGSGSGLAEKVKMLREQSRILHEQQVVDATAETRKQVTSPTEAAFFDDPTLAAGIHYIQSLSSTDIIDPVLGNNQTGIALGGETDENNSNGTISGRAKIVPSVSRSKPRISQSQPSFIVFESPPPRQENEGRTPPRIPLPAPPATQYFDLSESSSGSSSSSRGSGVIRHRAGQERILVGVNQPFNFPAPMHLPGSSPSQSSRVQIINDIKDSQTESILWAEMDDGSPLPEWLGFDSQEAEFWGIPERGEQGGTLKIKVYLQKHGEVKEVGRFIIEIVGR